MNAAAPAWEFRIPATRGASVIFGARLRQSSTPGAVNLAGCPWRLQRIDNAATGTPLQWIRRSSSTTTNGAGPFPPRTLARGAPFLSRVLKGGKLLWPEKEASIRRGLFNLLQTVAYIRRARRPREYIIIALPWNIKNLLTACSYDGIHKNLPLLLVDFERKELQILFEQRDEARKQNSIRYNTITDADDKGFIVPGTSALLPCDGGSGCGYGNSYVSGIGSEISGEWFRRFHPTCMGMIIDQAKKLDNFLCLDCAEENDTKRPSNSYQTSPNYDSKLVRRYTGDEVQSPVHTSIDVPSQPLAQEEFCGKLIIVSPKTASHIRDQQDKREWKSSSTEDVSFEFPNRHSHTELRVCTYPFGP